MKEGSVAILGGHVVDPKSGIDGVADVFISQGRVARVAVGATHASPLQFPGAVIKAEGCLVLPGLIDLHVHLRTPGEEEKEDPTSGGQAAARGGFTTICCMPNTRPALDGPEVLEQLLERCRRECAVRVVPFGATTRGNEGRELTDFAALRGAGAGAISDDAYPIQDSSLALEAFLKAAQEEALLVLHSEDLGLAVGARHRLAQERGNHRFAPTLAEEVMVARNILFCGGTGARLHLCHLSTSKGVGLLRWAKEEGIPVTGEATPHHLLLNDEALREWNAVAKVKPPLRAEEDRLAVVEGVKSGVVDVIATDHAPHLWGEKQWSVDSPDLPPLVGVGIPTRLRRGRDGQWPVTTNHQQPTTNSQQLHFEKAPSGIVGLETALPLVYTHLGIGMGELVRLMATRPAEILGLADRGHLGTGALGDVVIFDPRRSWKIEGKEFLSKAKFTPFEGWEVKGEVVATIVGGKVVYESKSQ